jgi:hypothetical protein
MPWVIVVKSSPHVGQNLLDTWTSVPQREQNMELGALG